MSASAQAIASTDTGTLPHDAALDSGSGTALEAGTRSAEVVASYARCAEVVRTRARNFYHGLRLLPEPKRSALYSIYAWMRAADDAVDEGGTVDEHRRRLDEFRTRTDRVLSGQLDFSNQRQTNPSPPPSPSLWEGVPFADALWPAFAQTTRMYPIERRIFFDTLAGMEDDLVARTYQTDEELSTYCYRVASTVGLACLRVWGLREGVSQKEADELAVWRGQAFQRTNILRDFRQDFDEQPRRVYLPLSAFERAGVTPEDVRVWRDPSRCGPFVARQAEIARAYYVRSAQLDDMIQPDCRATLWAMTRIYSGILTLIERDPRSIVGEKRLRLGGLSKCAIAAGALVRGRTGRW